MDDLLIDIREWYETNARPNGRRAYQRCPICNASWWGEGSSGLFGVERHNFGCWIPRLLTLAPPPPQVEQGQTKG